MRRRSLPCSGLTEPPDDDYEVYVFSHFGIRGPIKYKFVLSGIYEARRYVRNNHYDPYQLRNYSYKINMARLNISDLWLEVKLLLKSDFGKLFLKHNSYHRPRLS